jgi:hypothetical protein
MWNEKCSRNFGYAPCALLISVGIWLIHCADLIVGNQELALVIGNDVHRPA